VSGNEAAQTIIARMSLCLVILLALLGGLAGANCAAARVRAGASLQDPESNRTMSNATMFVCHATPGSLACRGAVLAAINKARASEGIGRMRLPADYAALSASEQLLVVSDLERVDRRLTPIIGLSRNLDRSALQAAGRQEDPTPDPFYGSSFGSNWAGGLPSVLEADFMWMYDDGPGSLNIDCRGPASMGCWGHRHDILGSYRAPLVMGAAGHGPSITELFVGGDLRAGPGEPDAPLSPSWPAIAR
jgi:hypothetical protein